MSIGLLALIDDVAALVKVSAASLDDVPIQVAKTSGKVAGIVIDDAAVTPKYVVGLDPKRELSVIFKIARRSLFNKLVFLGPATLLLGFFAPWAVQPILMLGAAYLCFEGYEKIHSWLAKAHGDPQATEVESVEVITPAELETMRVGGAIRTDLILSAEIMAITYSTVTAEPILNQITVMVSVAVFITIAVYGFVALIVKADDIGVHMAKTAKSETMRGMGRSLVRMMPPLLTVLSTIGTFAMLLVGGEIISHGVPALHHFFENLLSALNGVAILHWVVNTMIIIGFGLGVGAIVAFGHRQISKLRARHVKPAA